MRLIYPNFVMVITVDVYKRQGQTKQKLGNSEARGAVDSVVSEQLTYFLEQNPQVCLLYTSLQ